MVKSFILALVVMIATFSPVAAKKNHHPNHHERHQGVIAVYDRTSDAWNGVIEETVADFNAIMPPQGPRLVYVDQSGVLCAQDVKVCSGYVDPKYGGFAITRAPGEGEILLTDIIPLSRQGMEMIACHEFMHVLTQIPDDYIIDAIGNVIWQHPGTDSCVWNWSENPGSFDIATLKSVYGGSDHHKHHKHHKKRRH